MQEVKGAEISTFKRIIIRRVSTAEVSGKYCRAGMFLSLCPFNIHRGSTTSQRRQIFCSLDNHCASVSTVTGGAEAVLNHVVVFSYGVLLVSLFFLRSIVICDT